MASEPIGERPPSAELARASVILTDIRDSLDKTSALVSSLTTRITDGQLDTAAGLSFLELKSGLLAAYLTDLALLAGRRLAGGAVTGHAAIDRLIELRTVLERIRPIDHKLRYQVDKLVRIATTGQLGEDDPLRFKPQPGNLVSRLDEAGGSAEDGSESESGSRPAAGRQTPGGGRLYVPPKLTAVPYDGDDTAESRRERQLTAARRRALSTSVMHELGRQYLDTPDEVHELSDTYRRRATREQAERTKYEEDFMVRLPESRQERRQRGDVTTDWSLGSELTQRADLSALDGRLPNKGSKRKRAAKGAATAPKRRKGKGNKKPRFNL